VHKIAKAGSPKIDAEVATDLLAGLLMEQASAPSASAANSNSLPPAIYAVMVVTSLLTFATLVTGYQLLFAQQLFA
jgi:hypothetical protein